MVLSFLFTCRTDAPANWLGFNRTIHWAGSVTLLYLTLFGIWISMGETQQLWVFAQLCHVQGFMLLYVHGNINDTARCPLWYSNTVMLLFFCSCSPVVHAVISWFVLEYLMEPINWFPWQGNLRVGGRGWGTCASPIPLCPDIKTSTWLCSEVPEVYGGLVLKMGLYLEGVCL